MPRHSLFGSDPYLGLRVVRPHFLLWVRTVEQRVFQTNSKQFEFTVRIGNESTGDLEVSPCSGSHLIIKSRLWKYHLFRFIEASDQGKGFGGSYLIPLVEQFFNHLKWDCGCFESPPTPSAPTASGYAADAWKRKS